MAEFFNPTPKPVHRCPLPKLPVWGESRQGWRCDCGKAYVIEHLGPRDTNEGEVPYQWRRAREFDIDVLAVEPE